MEIKDNVFVVTVWADENDLLGKRFVEGWGTSYYWIYPKHPEWYDDEEDDDGFTLDQVKEYLKLDVLPPEILVLEDD